jgi:maleylpyruvate isomerase
VTTTTPPTPSLAAFDQALDEMARATDRLLATVDGFSDDDVRAPSGLPEWTRAHVLTHLARNADGVANLAHWARTGEERRMYPGGPEGRNAAIEEGASRHVGDLRLDLGESAERLLAAFADFDDEALTRVVAGPRETELAGWGLPDFRLREVAIHHLDLAAGYTSADWTPAFVARTLDELAPEFLARGDCPVAALKDPGGGEWQVGTSGPTLSGPAHELVAWVIGRSDGAALTPSPPGAVPAAPRWR